MSLALVSQWSLLTWLTSLSKGIKHCACWSAIAPSRLTQSWGNTSCHTTENRKSEAVTKRQNGRDITVLKWWMTVCVLYFQTVLFLWGNNCYYSVLHCYTNQVMPTKYMETYTVHCVSTFLLPHSAATDVTWRSRILGTAFLPADLPAQVILCDCCCLHGNEHLQMPST